MMVSLMLGDIFTSGHGTYLTSVTVKTDSWKVPLPLSAERCAWVRCRQKRDGHE